MTQNRALLATAVILTQVLGFALQGSYAQRDLTHSRIRVSLEKTAITLHEPAIIRVTVDNGDSEKNIVFDPGFEGKNVAVIVEDPHGIRHKKRNSTIQEGMKFGEAIHVRPGESGVVLFVLNDWFNFDDIGKYQIDVALPPLAYTMPIPPAVIHTRLTLSVLPRDETKLTSTCAQLLARVGDQSYTVALTAAKALLAVDDPTVVSFLAEAAKRKGVYHDDGWLTGAHEHRSIRSRFDFHFAVR